MPGWRAGSNQDWGKRFWQVVVASLVAVDVVLVPRQDESLRVTATLFFRKLPWPIRWICVLVTGAHLLSLLPRRFDPFERVGDLVLEAHRWVSRMTSART